MCPNDKSFGKFFPSESDNLQEYCMRKRRDRRDRERQGEKEEREIENANTWLYMYLVLIFAHVQSYTRLSSSLYRISSRKT